MCLPGGSEPDVVGEDGGAVHVVVAVDGVDAVDDGDSRGASTVRRSASRSPSSPTPPAARSSPARCRRR